MHLIQATLSSLSALSPTLEGSQPALLSTTRSPGTEMKQCKAYFGQLGGGLADLWCNCQFKWQVIGLAERYASRVLELNDERRDERRCALAHMQHQQSEGLTCTFR